jgi:hypothetical protein
LETSWSTSKIGIGLFHRADLRVAAGKVSAAEIPVPIPVSAMAPPVAATVMLVETAARSMEPR